MRKFTIRNAKQYLLLALFLPLLAIQVFADSFTESQTLLPRPIPSFSYDQMGNSMAVSGDYAVGAGKYSGEIDAVGAYVYEK